MVVHSFYQQNCLNQDKLSDITRRLQKICGDIAIENLEAELCYYIEVDNGDEYDEKKMLWLLAPSFHENFLSKKSQFMNESNHQLIIEIGPRLNFSTPFSSNAVSIFKSCGFNCVSRIEYSIRYLISFQEFHSHIKNLRPKLTETLHDRMTECEYTDKIKSFHITSTAKLWHEVDVSKEGKAALEKISKQLGLAFDDWDLNYYTDLFKNVLKRNPTSVECFDLGQSNSEHSRHWFFKGKLIINGETTPKSLMDMVIHTQNSSNDNNVIKFSDNSSAIQGYEVNLIRPSTTLKSSSFERVNLLRHITFTAETHNFPTGVSPFSGATTGTGGRIRDGHAAGQGSHVVAGTAGYCFGNICIPGYKLPWEDETLDYPDNFARPLSIAIEASNGASDYGNKFGEPIICGFARSFGMKLSNDERREWIKPIMFTGGIGQIDDNLIVKDIPNKNMSVVKIGGPVYRIGVGGGAASSIKVQGSSKASLDFDAVQRGDAEMAQKLNRFVRGCIESSVNPICSIHDQGAGGNGNVLKEICEPAGAVIYADKFKLGDPTISIMELWGAEYQESDAILVRKKDIKTIEAISKREKCPISIVGDVNETERIVLKEKSDVEESKYPVDLNLSSCLPSGVQKTFESERIAPTTSSFILPDNTTVQKSLNLVLRLPSVASKRYLTTKVDRSVTGLIAQQQCVGPLHIPLADVAVTALSYFETVGSATAIGEQPIKGLLNSAAGARLSIAESLTNLVFAKISHRKDIKCSCNWMWAAKQPGEVANIYDACKAMCNVMTEIGIAVDGGKDSLSMAARVKDDIVKAPGQLVVSSYAPCADINLTITPNLRCPNDEGCLLYVIPSSELKFRLGGSALAQVYGQLGDVVPDLDYPSKFANAFDIIQSLFPYICSGHDVSDGGLITCLLEMAFAGNCGIEVHMDSATSSPHSVLFAEEVGWVLEVSKEHKQYVKTQFMDNSILCTEIGESIPHDQVKITINGSVVVSSTMTDLRDTWEATSFELDKLQATESCVSQEQNGLAKLSAPQYIVNFVPDSPKLSSLGEPNIRVAVLREEGTNGDREMAAALHMAGFQVWDVTMQDLVDLDLNSFSGLIFPGGFSYADVLGSAKGWAASLLFNDDLKTKLKEFYSRTDTFSLGICNGCQLMALLGFVSADATIDENEVQGVALVKNKSGRFESRFSTIRIEKSPSIMLAGMEGSVLGVWVAHAEGQFQFKNKETYSRIKQQSLVPVRYVDNSNNVTEAYPFNPNGSVDGVAALCSENGRHLAMMPHPERCILPWQWPHVPEELKSFEMAPWFRMFGNAYQWCCSH